MVRGRHAVVDRVFQLCRPAGHLLRLPVAQKRIRSRSGAAWPARVLLRLGLWPKRAIRGRHRGPAAPEISDPGWAAHLEPDLHGHCAFPQLHRAAFFPWRGRPWGDTLFSCIDVASERLSRPGNPVARAGPASNQRLYRDHRRWILRGTDRAALRLALVVRGVRWTWNTARPGTKQMVNRTQPGAIRTATVRKRLSQPYCSAPDGGISLRQLRRSGAALVDADVSP